MLFLTLLAFTVMFDLAVLAAAMLRFDGDGFGLEVSFGPFRRRCCLLC